MRTFLVKDVYTDPKFQEKPKKAELKLKVRLDSRGEVLKRAILGDRELYR